jgi:hypothetical protein
VATAVLTWLADSDYVGGVNSRRIGAVSKGQGAGPIAVHNMLSSVSTMGHQAPQSVQQQIVMLQVALFLHTSGSGLCSGTNIELFGSALRRWQGLAILFAGLISCKAKALLLTQP